MQTSAQVVPPQQLAPQQLPLQQLVPLQQAEPHGWPVPWHTPQVPPRHTPPQQYSPPQLATQSPLLFSQQLVPPQAVAVALPQATQAVPAWLQTELPLGQATGNVGQDPWLQ